MLQNNNRKRVILWFNAEKPLALQHREELLGWLHEQVDVVGDFACGEFDLAQRPEADLMIVLGGDGTILSTVRSLAQDQLPVIGINMGKLGFLADFTHDQLKESFAQIIEDLSLISHRVMLHCKISGPDRDDFETLAVNELAMIAGPPFRMIEVAIRIGTEKLATCRGDGLIVSTPTGSTAYNLSAGGPILEPELQGAAITPLAAHSLSFRPIVVNLDSPIELRCPNTHGKITTTHSTARDVPPTAMAVIDGQVSLPITSEDTVVLSRSSAAFQLIRQSQTGKWQLLSNKLNWGVTPKYQVKDTNHENARA
jgi:NAD+ kinase